MITRVPAVVFVLMVVTLTAIADEAKFVLVRSVTEIDEDADGRSVPYIVVNYSYDHGVLVGSLLESDLNGDGIMDRRSISTLTYDSQARRIQDVNESYDIATGALDARGIITYTYDSTGNRTGSDIEADSNADGVLDYISTTAFSYDERGNLVGWTADTDRDADGTWDSVETVTRVYDEGDNLILSVREIDDGRDGQLEKRETWRYTVDSRDNRTVAEHEIDFYADGIVDYSDRTAYVYDRGGRLRSSTTEYAFSFEEGVVERSTSESSYFYDRHGNQIRVVQENDAYADGVIDDIRTTTRTYSRIRGKD